ncbi:MAG: hypothetical protein ACO1OB_13115 [Archangium sp.]
MHYDYTRYLRAKTTVDDRALNRVVLETLKTQLAGKPVDVLEIGAGVGTMISRALSWGIVSTGAWTLLDEDAVSLEDARRWLAEWCAARQKSCESRDGELLLDGRLRVRFVCSKLHDWLDTPAGQYSLLVANAFLDLVELSESLPRLARLLSDGGAYWFTINFDGESIFVPASADDAAVLDVYHRSMNTRVRDGRRAGSSRTGRELFEQLEAAGLAIRAAGSSDWVVHPTDGAYADDEGYFLHHIIHTVEAELRSRPAEVDATVVNAWGTRRHAEIDQGRLAYIAHQLDFTGVRR